MKNNSNTTEIKNVLILEDEVVIANSLKLHIQKNGFHAFIATSVEKAIDLYSNNKMDVVVCDINLNSESDGIDFVESSVDSSTPVIYLTAYNDLSTIKRAESTRPYAYLIKPFNGDQLFSTLNLALINYNGRRHARQGSGDQEFSLTPREIEIVNLLAKGLNAEEIATELHISFNTIRTHRKNMLHKLECSNTTELVVKCITNGVLEIG
ncbi:DNA-binding response regulator [Marinigracilibium pacificum]|uniref:Response regulator transcription factor n=1 Tax=Marinigracilibium pacificum TaxID=2729599 RepID=A0A848JCT5_9BACT|nr:DNA-binding response regulator [Marinigracilibium pacificum]NMM50812.1 response regulator transcription factor [Marinigracilibium pacificum]